MNFQSQPRDELRRSVHRRRSFLGPPAKARSTNRSARLLSCKPQEWYERAGTTIALAAEYFQRAIRDSRNDQSTSLGNERSETRGFLNSSCVRMPGLRSESFLPACFREIRRAYGRRYLASGTRASTPYTARFRANEGAKFIPWSSIQRIAWVVRSQARVKAVRVNPA